MSHSPTAHSPIVIDRVERSRGDGESVTLRLAGHRLTAATEADLDVLLVVDLHGRRHRFAASGPEPGDPAPGGWETSFALPDWAVPVEYGQASIWVGSWSVPVPPVGTKPHTPDPARASAADAEAPGAAVAPPLVPRPPMPALAYGGVEASRAGPLADALIRDTVSALHAELAQRSERETALGVALDRARSELTARTSSQAELEATHSELRGELARLTEAVAEQQAEFDRRLREARERFESELAEERSKLADGAQERDGLRSELAGARTETDRVRAELTQGRAEQERAATELAEARARRESAASELAEARAQRESAASELAEARAAQERVATELSQARADHERGASELAQARAESDRVRAELTAAREQQVGFEHTRDRLAEANDQLTAALRSEQLRAQEATSLREQLAAAQISRDAAIAEAEGVRSELMRVGSELAVSRERSGAAGDDFGEAQQLLEDARALTAQLRQPSVE